MKAVFSDAHGNLEALRAVIRDAEKHRVDGFYCLGDTTGYGPNPLECLDLTMAMPVVLLGNNDQGVLSDPIWFWPSAERSIYWLRSQLESPVGDPLVRERRTRFLMSRPKTHQEEGVLYVHASPRNPLNEYVFPEDIYNMKKLQAIADHFDRLCFNGHTHLPGVFRQTKPGSWEFISSEELGDVHRLDGRKTICNVGSVGQPRDGDWRACYVLFDGETIRFRRVEYDVDTTVKKIYAIPELENFFGDRLREGR